MAHKMYIHVFLVEYVACLDYHPCSETQSLFLPCVYLEYHTVYLGGNNAEQDVPME